jgi:hypothetical protein
MLSYLQVPEIPGETAGKMQGKTPGETGFAQGEKGVLKGPHSGANISGRKTTTFLVCVVLSLMIANLVIVALIRRDLDLHKFFPKEQALDKDNVGESSSTQVQRTLSMSLASFT